MTIVAALCVLKVAIGGDGLGKIGAALVARVGPVCDAIRQMCGGFVNALWPKLLARHFPVKAD